MTQKEQQAMNLLPEPRPIEDIRKEFTQLCAANGQDNYTIKSLAAQVEARHARMSELNLEAKAREEADKKAPAATESSQGEVKDEPTPA